MCEICKNWVRDYSREELITSCHPDCINRDAESEAKKHLKRLIELIEHEASMGDGIPEEFYDSYKNAKLFIGLK